MIFTFMHLVDAFIQSNMHFFLSVHAFPGIRTHALEFARAMLLYII